jgi:hypothetical protein
VAQRQQIKQATAAQVRTIIQIGLRQHRQELVDFTQAAVVAALKVHQRCKVQVDQAVAVQVV